MISFQSFQFYIPKYYNLIITFTIWSKQTPQNNMTNKPQVKPQKRYFYLWQRINTFDQQRTLDAYSIMHLITPSSHAKMVCISQKFEYIIGSIYCPPTTANISPLFEFLVFRQILLDYISPDYKKTNLQDVMIEQLTKGYNRVRDDSKIKHISDVVIKIFNQFYNDKLDQGQGYKKLKKLREGHRRQRLKYLRMIQSQRMEQYIRVYLHTQREKGVLGTEQYIRSQFEQVKNIQLLTIPQQYSRWRNFQTLHKKTLRCYYDEKKQNKPNDKPNVNSLKINRPSTEVQPILMRLSEHVQLRSQWTDYGPENQVFIKDLVQQLKKFHLNSSMFDIQYPELNFYTHTSPQYVLFDQITLRPKLSYEPLLLELFGLAKRPVSSQCKIVWFCTPKQFDYFQGEDELQPLDPKKLDMRLTLSDPFYGTDYMYSRPIPSEIVQRQKQQLQIVKENICVDRFLLTSYYLREGKEFGRPQQRISYAQIEHDFMVQLKRAKSKIQKDASNLKHFLGKLAQGASGMFNFKFSEFVQSLSIDQDDSVLEAQRYVKVIRYLNMRYTFIRETFSVLTNDRFFSKMSNPKKYIFLFFVLGLQVLEQIRLSCIEGGRTGDIPAFRRHIEQNGRKMKNGKTAFHWLDGIFAKVEDYRTKASNTNNKFLLQGQGKKLLETFKRLNQAIRLEYRNMDDICEKLEEQSKDARDQGKEKLIQVKNRSKIYIADVTIALTEFCKKQFGGKNPAGPHKLPDEKNQDTEQLYKMITKKFDLSTQALFTSSPQNFIVYDSMLTRLLHPEETDHLENLINAKPPLLREMLKKERECLNQAAAIIGTSIKKMPDEKRKKDILDQKLYF